MPFLEALGGLIGRIGITNLVMLGMIAQNIGDWIVYGPNMKANAQKTLEDLKARMEPKGITSYGQFTQGEVEALYNAYLNLGVVAIENPFKKISQPFTLENFKTLLQDMILDYNTKGIAPTKQEIVERVGSFLTKKDATKISIPLTQEAKAEVEKAKNLATLRISETIKKKPKLFIGTILGGRVLAGTTFEPRESDLITNEADLRKAAENNLLAYIPTLPGRLRFDIEIRNNFIDREGTRRLGPVVVLIIYIFTTRGQRVKLDEIVLGKINPVIYYPTSDILQSTSLDLANAAQPEKTFNIKMPSGEIFSVDSSGNIIKPFLTKDEANLVPTSSLPLQTTPPPQPTPPPSKDYFEYVIQRGDTLSEIARKFNTSITAIMDLNPKIKDPNLIYAGDILKIPGKKPEVPPPQPTPTPAPAPTPTPPPPPPAPTFWRTEGNDVIIQREYFTTPEGIQFLRRAFGSEFSPASETAKQQGLRMSISLARSFGLPI